MAAIELGGETAAGLVTEKDGYMERKRWGESGGLMAEQLIAVRIVKKKS